MSGRKGSFFCFTQPTQYKILKMFIKYVDIIQNIGYNIDVEREKSSWRWVGAVPERYTQKKIGGESDVQRNRNPVLRPPVTAYLKAQQSRISAIFLHSELFVRRTRTPKKWWVYRAATAAAFQTKTIKTVTMSELRRINGNPAQQKTKNLYAYRFI